MGQVTCGKDANLNKGGVVIVIRVSSNYTYCNKISSRSKFGLGHPFHLICKRKNVLFSILYVRSYPKIIWVLC